MGQQDMVGSPQHFLQILVSGRVDALEIAHGGDDPRFVEGHPMLDPVAEMAADDISIFDEVVGCGSGWPAPLILKCLGQVPMIECGEGL